MGKLLEEFKNDFNFATTINNSRFLRLNYDTELDKFFVFSGDWLILSVTELDGSKLFVESPFKLDKSLEFGRSVLYDSLDDALADSITLLGTFIIALTTLESNYNVTLSGTQLATSKGLIKVCEFGNLVVSIDDLGFRLTYNCMTSGVHNGEIQVPYDAYKIMNSLSARLIIEIDGDIVASNNFPK